DERQDLPPVDAGHFHVEENDVVERVLNEVNRLGAVEGEVNYIGLRLLEFLLKEGGKGGFVVNDEDFILLGHRRRTALFAQDAFDCSEQIDKVIRLADKILGAVL